MEEKNYSEVKSPPLKAKKRLSLNIPLTLLAIVISIGAIFSLQQFLRNPNENIKSDSKLSSEFSRLKIGGPFSLVDQNGLNVSEKNFLGKHMLVFFGYTFCPDVCPTALSNITDAMGLLGKKVELITPIFVTIDPDRDTAPNLKEYSKFFYPKLVYLTGTKEEIGGITKAYRVFFAKAKENKIDAYDYLMDHSIGYYLMGPDGKFITNFSHGLEPELLAKKINQYLDN